MSDLRTAAQQALEALEADCCGGCDAEYNPCRQRRLAESLRAALAQQAEPVEPVAWMVYTEGGASAYVTDNPCDLIGAYRALPLYTAPPQRKPLTEEEIESCRQKGYAHAGLGAPFDFGKAARAVEKASWEKNHGQA